jgi:hypothetical protein
MSTTSSLNISRLTPSFIYLYIASWNQDQLATSNNTEINKSLKSLIEQQLGTGTASLFSSSFINYKEGYLLCVNTSSILNKFFSGTATSDVAFQGISGSLKFTAVKMPDEFIGASKSNLSSTYQYGDKLKVGFSLEVVPISDKVQKQRNDTVTSNTSQILVYRDMNMRGRSKSGGGTASAGVGVWS